MLQTFVIIIYIGLFSSLVFPLCMPITLSIFEVGCIFFFRFFRILRRVFRHPLSLLFIHSVWPSVLPIQAVPFNICIGCLSLGFSQLSLTTTSFGLEMFCLPAMPGFTFPLFWLVRLHRITSCLSFQGLPHMFSVARFSYYSANTRSDEALEDILRASERRYDRRRCAPARACLCECVSAPDAREAATSREERRRRCRREVIFCVMLNAKVH